jgi:hypothetical protein
MRMQTRPRPTVLIPTAGCSLPGPRHDARPVQQPVAPSVDYAKLEQTLKQVLALKVSRLAAKDCCRVGSKSSLSTVAESDDEC